MVGSLWPLRDDHAAELFNTFYRHLGRGMSVAEALARAQREQIEAGVPPAGWAGVIALGLGSRVPLPGGDAPPSDHRWRVLFVTLTALCAVAFLFLGVHWKARRGEE